jgi:PPK2 family polyphosphate:nucleotide phosphotransferase
MLKPASGKIKLKDIPTDDTGNFKEKQMGLDALNADLERLAELQEILYAQGQHSLLLVFQAMDTGGKDGSIKRIGGAFHPQGIRCVSFKVPSKEELAHDFLWRIRAHTPGKGEIAIFNRSHYEDVLIVRVKNLAPEDVWRKRYAHIRHFEKNLADAGTTIVKFYLHISKDEQKERLQARLDDPSKHWKFNVGDLGERKRWDDYREAYEEAISETSTDYAPWYVVPADRKWYRDAAIARVLVKTLEKLDLKYPEAEKGLKKIKIV